MLASVDYLIIQVEIFLVLIVMSDFQLISGHFGYYVRRFPILLKYSIWAGL